MKPQKAQCSLNSMGREMAPPRAGQRGGGHLPRQGIWVDRRIYCLYPCPLIPSPSLSWCPSSSLPVLYLTPFLTPLSPTPSLHPLKSVWL